MGMVKFLSRRLAPASAGYLSDFHKGSKAAVSAGSCCSLCRVAEPVAGLAEALRDTTDRARFLNRVRLNLRFKYHQAPMFSGSSCTQTSGTPSGYGGRAEFIASSGKG